MKKILIAAFLIFATNVSVFSQSYESPFHVSFFPPLSTNGRQAAQYTNGASFNILVGISRNEKAFTLGGLANIITNDANGLQLAGLLNSVGNDGNGLLMSGLANIVRNDYTGLQFAGLFNTTGRLDGSQFGGVGNKAGDVSGAQFGGLGNIAGDVTGAQFAGLGNVAGDVKGSQFGGLFNVAKNVSGAQFAGLVNIAESSDCPIALVNIIKNGEYGIAVTYNEAGSAVLALRSGGRITYGILGVGYNHKTKGDGYVIEGGIGAHINITGWFRINNEIKGGSIGDFSDTNTFYSNYALLPAFRIGNHFELFGGPSINYMQTDNVADNKNLFPSGSLWKKRTDAKWQQVYIGWQAGVQFVF